MNIFILPLELYPAWVPIWTLLSLPVVPENPASTPIFTFFSFSVPSNPALLPIAILSEPVVWWLPALGPILILLSPVLIPPAPAPLLLPIAILWLADCANP